MDFLKCHVNNPKVSIVGDETESKRPHGREVSRSLESKKKGVRTNVCDHCGYVAPFCYYYVTKECSNIAKNVPCGTEKESYET